MIRLRCDVLCMCDNDNDRSIVTNSKSDDDDSPSAFQRDPPVLTKMVSHLCDKNIFRVTGHRSERNSIFVP
jgi:hypothetical protein